MKRFMTFFYLTLVAVTLSLILMANGCSGCVGGDACGDWATDAAKAHVIQTERSAGRLLHIQLTEMAR
jgi:hypothetical protein